MVAATAGTPDRRASFPAPSPTELPHASLAIVPSADRRVPARVRRQPAIRGRGRAFRPATTAGQLLDRRPRRRAAGRARRPSAVPQRARRGQRRARRAAQARQRVPDRLGDQAVRRRRPAQAGRGRPGLAGRSAVQVPARLPERRAHHRAPAAQPHLRREELHRHPRRDGRSDPHGPEHRPADRQLQEPTGGLRARRAVGLQQLRLRAGRRGDRGRQRPALARLPAAGLVRAAGPEAHPLGRRPR